jgi:GNAT superfamily N-acetyltransferase
MAAAGSAWDGVRGCLAAAGNELYRLEGWASVAACGAGVLGAAAVGLWLLRSQPAGCSTRSAAALSQQTLDVQETVKGQTFRVRTLRNEADHQEAAVLVSRAFFDNEGYGHVYPDSRSRFSQLRQFMSRRTSVTARNPEAISVGIYTRRSPLVAHSRPGGEDEVLVGVCTMAAYQHTSQLGLVVSFFQNWRRYGLGPAWRFARLFYSIGRDDEEALRQVLSEQPCTNPALDAVQRSLRLAASQTTPAASVSRASTCVLELQMVAVDPNMQGSGLGTCAMKHLLALTNAAVPQPRLILLSTPKQINCDFYARLGFSLFVANPYRPGFTYYLMIGCV